MKTLKKSVFGIAAALCCAAWASERTGYVVVTDFVAADGKTDVADAIQKVIDEHPNRTIYFPDGTYLLSHPIATSPHPNRSVDLRLSNYAILKASPEWKEKAALVRLGGKEKENEIRIPGSNYGLTGGILDGSDKADGVSIDCGRETRIEGVSIKHVRIGIHLKEGYKWSSSDADVVNVNVVGNQAPDSIGVLAEGYDNTISNMRISDVHIGVDLRSAGNSLRNIHPLYTCWGKDDYETSAGFIDRTGNNWYSFAYSDNFAVGFRLTSGKHSQFDSCFCWWYSPNGKTHRAVEAEKKFGSTFNDLTIGFPGAPATNDILRVATPGGKGTFNRIHGTVDRSATKVHEAYLK